MTRPAGSSAPYRTTLGKLNSLSYRAPNVPIETARGGSVFVSRRIIKVCGLGLVAVSVAASVGIAAAEGPCARFCGDPNGDERITVSDGVQVLRQAAELTSTCKNRQCDADGNGTVGVTDGVVVLRRSAGLGAALKCDTNIDEIVGEAYTGDVEFADDDRASLCMDQLPEQASVTQDIQAVDPSTMAGGDAAIGFKFASLSSRQLLIGAASTGGTTKRGFYVLPLERVRSAEVGLGLNAESGFQILYSTNLDGKVTSYVSQRVDAESPDPFGENRKYSFGDLADIKQIYRPASGPVRLVVGR
jgi:hypothetical protein